MLSMLRGAYIGEGAAVASAAMSGAESAVTLCIGLLGPICLWSAVISLMEESGIAKALGKLLMPVIKGLFPYSARNRAVRESLCSNITANLLGLGNAATPAGLAAVESMSRLGAGANRELSRFVVMNTASIQLLPTTIAAVRAANGAKDAFDILPAVLLASAIALCVGLVVCELITRNNEEL